MVGGKEKEKIMLNVSDLQIVVTEHERKTKQNKNTTEDFSRRFMCVTTPCLLLHV